MPGDGREAALKNMKTASRTLKCGRREGGNLQEQGENRYADRKGLEGEDWGDNLDNPGQLACGHRADNSARFLEKSGWMGGREEGGRGEKVRDGKFTLDGWKRMGEKEQESVGRAPRVRHFPGNRPQRNKRNSKSPQLFDITFLA
jgi:hypothetical protein